MLNNTYIHRIHCIQHRRARYQKYPHEVPEIAIHKHRAGYTCTRTPRPIRLRRARTSPVDPGVTRNNFPAAMKIEIPLQTLAHTRGFDPVSPSALNRQPMIERVKGVSTATNLPSVRNPALSLLAGGGPTDRPGWKASEAPGLGRIDGGTA